MEYSLEFSLRLIEAARSFFDNDKIEDETGRAVLYLSLLSCEISLKALLEKAGISVEELKKRSHDISGLLKDLCSCDLIGTGIAGSKPHTGSRLLSVEVSPKFSNVTVGALLKFEEQGGSKYPNEIRYGELVKHYPPSLMLDCATKVYEWSQGNISKIKRKK